MWIPESLYNQIVSVMPIPTVEAIILNKENNILVLKRNNPPAKNHWWFSGGRVQKGETIDEALVRKVKEETGLDVEVGRLVGVYTRLFPERHDIAITFLCKSRDGKITLNQEHSEASFMSVKDAVAELHPELKKVLKDAFVLSNNTEL
jgi:8-oxo-dGTP diphosphatase